MRPAAPNTLPCSRSGLPVARFVVEAITLATLFPAACGRPAGAPADLILADGDVLTLGSPGVVEALAVRGDRVVAAGTS